MASSYVSILSAAFSQAVLFHQDVLSYPAKLLMSTQFARQLVWG